MIYITCPGNTYTGGPTLAHQLCNVLNKNGIPAKMLYVGNLQKGISPVHENYRHFQNPYVTKLIDSEDDILVVLETKTHLVKKYKKAKKYIWWMSVDNYFVSKLTMKERMLRKLGLFSFEVNEEMKKKKRATEKIVLGTNIEHLVQSEYARIFLESVGVKSSKIFSLTDYVEEEIWELSNGQTTQIRQNRVLYNPKKGYEFTKKIIDAMDGANIEFMPLINMSKQEVVRMLCSSKMYIDFGNHPGKDRFPREAVACGCCVVTGMRGSAGNEKDIPINVKYKFKDTEDNIPAISRTICQIMDDYDTCWKDYELYRESIGREKDSFEKEVLNIFKRKCKQIQ